MGMILIYVYEGKGYNSYLIDKDWRVALSNFKGG